MTVQQDSTEDHRWLVSPAAEPWIEKAAAANPVSAAVKQLRTDLSPARTHLVVELVDLRRRARVKFSAADQLFFTRKGFEQASDEVVAGYKADRILEMDGVAADFCTGIGGDLMALARAGGCLGIEKDAGIACFAEANCGAMKMSHVAMKVGDVCQYPLESLDSVHIDPDRRTGGRRTTHMDHFEPGREFLDRLRRSCRNVCLKLAPATRLHEAWVPHAEVEFLGSRGECRQQVVWFGDVARHPGRTVATVVDATTGPRTVVHRSGRVPVVSAPGSFLYEPHATVIAAGLVDALAIEHDMNRLALDIAYLTSNALARDAALATFQVEEVLPMDMKRLKAFVKARGIGRLEVKRRGVDLEPAEIRRKLRNEGPDERTLILYPGKSRVHAVVAKRI